MRKKEKAQTFMLRWKDLPLGCAVLDSNCYKAKLSSTGLSVQLTGTRGMYHPVPRLLRLLHLGVVCIYVEDKY